MEQLLSDPAFPEIDHSMLDKIIEDQVNQILNPQPKITKKKRSRNGCARCKKLKIKCNEGKPICDYCQHRGAECHYPGVIPSLAKRQKIENPVIKNIIINESNSNPSIAKPKTFTSWSKDDYLKCVTNVMETPHEKIIKPNTISIISQLNTFEERLFKIFMDFAPSFFTFDINLEARQFWINEIPALFQSSKLIQNSVFTLSSTRLLYLYKSDFMNNANIDFTQFDLYKKALDYQSKAVEMMRSILELTPHTQLTPDMMGQLTVSKIILLGTKAIFPYRIDPEKTIPSSGILELVNFIKFSSPSTTTTIQLLKNTKYIQIFTLDESITPSGSSSSLFATPLGSEDSTSSFYTSSAGGAGEQQKFLFIEYLRSYVSKQHPNSFDLEKITFHDAIAMMELGANRSLYLKYPIPFFKSLVKFSRDEDFAHLLEQENHTAMKIIFYLSSLCSVLDIRLLPGLGVWDEYIEIYKNYSLKRFNGEMENKFDENVYNLVIARGNGELPYDLALLKWIGLPVDDFKNGKVTLVENEFKCDIRV